MATTATPTSMNSSSAAPPHPPPAARLPSSQSRQSRFTEMEDRVRTPTPPPPPRMAESNSSSPSPAGPDAGERRRNRRRFRGLGVAPRVLNGCSHGVACVLLLAIMAGFLGEARGRFISPQAIALMVLLALDVVLDMGALARLRKRWPGWAVLLRLTCGIGYLTLFMVYVGIGNVFPYQYIYWGIETSYAGPVVYLFLWLIGVWNLLHTALHRHALGHSIRACVAALRTRSSSRRAPTNGGTQETGHSDAGSLWGHWGRWMTRMGDPRQPGMDLEGEVPSGERNDMNDVSLAERNGDDNKTGSQTTTTLSRWQTNETADTAQHRGRPTVS